MKNILLSLLTLPLICSVALAEENACVPASATVCTLNSVCLDTTAYYQLSTTFQLVTSTYVDAAISGVCQLDPVAAKAAEAKLVAQAQQLKVAGVCKVVINNL